MEAVSSEKLSDKIDKRMTEMLGLLVYVVISRPVEPSDVFVLEPDVLWQHIMYTEALERKGVLMAAGPTVDGSGQLTSVGMFVVRASSEDEAHEIVSQDPLHLQGLRSFEVMGWRINEGRMAISVDFSTGKFRFE